MTAPFQKQASSLEIGAFGIVWAFVPGDWSLLRRGIFLLFSTVLLTSCVKNNAPIPDDPHLKSFGSIEVIARLLEIPEGAIFQRDLYDYASVLKYEVVSVQRGSLEKGAIIYVGQYNPWKPRAEAADNRVKNIGGNLRQFRAGQLHHMALEVPIDEHFMGGIVDKYFGKHTGPVYWALWTDQVKR